MSNVVKFPGNGGSKIEDDVSTETVFTTLNGEKLKEVFVVGIRENGEIIVSGNCTVAHGVYLAEMGKAILVESSVQK